MPNLRLWVKNHLPFGIVCRIANALNRPWLEDIHRTERIVEYAWVLAEIGRHKATWGFPFPSTHRPYRILDFGYAGSYFAEMLCLVGEVTGVDPRRTPDIRHPRFRYIWPLQGTGFDTIVCISVLEHLKRPEMFLRGLYNTLAAGGQLLVTVPYGLEKRFQGYKPFGEVEISRWLGYVEHRVLIRQDGGWVERDQNSVTRSNTEHEVNAVALVRLSRASRQEALGESRIAPPLPLLSR